MRKLPAKALMIAGCVLLVPQLSGCKKGQLEPEFASSVDQPSYAKVHPARLKSTLTDLDTQLTLVDTVTAEFKDYPDKLKDPDWPAVSDVVDRADVEGKSPHYAEQLEQNAKVATFYEEEKPEIQKAVGGAVQYQAKNKGCDVDMYSPAVHAMDRAVDKRLEERARAKSEAHSYISMHESKLGKANIEPLEDQAEQIAFASYVVHVGLVRKKNQLDQLLSEASGVESTLNERLEELKAAPPDDKAPASEKKAYEEEIASLEAAKQELAEELGSAKQQAQTAEERIKQAQQKYEDALTQLKAALDERAKASAE